MKLELFHPLKVLSINQNFTENNACCFPDNTHVINRTTATCPTGYVSLYTNLGLKGHNGLDLAAQDWQPVYAALEGVVQEVQTDRQLGLGLGIVSQQQYDWNDAFSSANGTNQIKVRYWHLAGFNVKMGDAVKVGDLLGWADNTGYSSGSHLHFECKPVKDGANILQGNGMFGCIDPLPYLQDISAQEKQGFLRKIKYQLADALNQLQTLLAK